MKNNPYFSHGDREAILREHEAKVAEGDATHATIAADIRAMVKANSRKNVRTQVRCRAVQWGEGRICCTQVGSGRVKTALLARLLPPCC